MWAMSQVQEKQEVPLEVLVPLDSLIASIRRLDAEALRAVRQAADEALSEAAPAPAGAEPDADAELQASIARGRAQMARTLASQEETSRLVHDVLCEWGIDGRKPVAPERLREIMRQDGIRDEDNAFSREIVAMREE